MLNKNNMFRFIYNHVFVTVDCGDYFKLGVLAKTQCVKFCNLTNDALLKIL